MPALARSITDVAAPADSASAEEGRVVLRLLLRALDRLVPAHRRDDPGPPPEWFRYSPF